ncbi:MAG: hypothetical protein LBV09_05675 [Deferribacteraceae bacterium]|jgi:hypothetical protein|nr:hypothetical protein [Deferribacteraceae bacterium]
MLYTLLLFTFCFLINIPMGIWRSKHRKFSLQWFISIHAPVPLVIILRLALGISYYAIPLFIFGSIMGQLVGGRVLSQKGRTKL